MEENINVEIPKLEKKLAELREELWLIRPALASNSRLMGRSVTLCEHITECEKMIANTRVSNLCGFEKGLIQNVTLEIRC